MTDTSEKSALRRAMTTARAAVPAASRTAAGTAIAGRALAELPLPPDAVVSGFCAIGDEIDPAHLMAALAARGHRLALPVVQGRGKPLLFRAYMPGDVLGRAGFGLREPGSDKAALRPDVLLVPLLAIDRAGWRLGYGAGYYDRTIADLRREKPVVTIGVAFDEQIVETVPHEPHDEPLDWLLTPTRLARARR